LSDFKVPGPEIEHRMRPGQYSRRGFLGADESLEEVLLADARALQQLRVTGLDLAQRLGALLEAAVEAKKATVRIEHFRVRLRRYKGAQICPFTPPSYEMACPGGAAWMGSFDWEIQNQRSGTHVKGPGLIVHLISLHGFFEGVQSPYRVEPRELAELLQLGPFRS
jgi:hypothetical protein